MPLPDRKDYCNNEDAYQRALHRARAEEFWARRHYEYMAANRDISVSNYLCWGLDRAAAEDRANREYEQNVRAFEQQRAEGVI